MPAEIAERQPNTDGIYKLQAGKYKHKKYTRKQYVFRIIKSAVLKEITLDGSFESLLLPNKARTCNQPDLSKKSIGVTDQRRLFIGG